MKRTMLLIAGAILTFLGILGAFLPILPTTPFILGAAICFSHSSEWAYSRLAKNKHFGPYIENYRTGQGIPKKTKQKAVIKLWLLLFLSMFLVRKAAIIGMLFLVGLAVTFHLYSIKTKRE